MANPQKKIKTKSSQRKAVIRWISILGCVVILLGVIFFIRGWVRASMMPKTISVFYANGVQKTMDIQIRDLQDPFTSLGYKSIDKQMARCQLTGASKFKTEIVCAAHYHAYALTPTDSNSKAAIMQKVASLQALLKQNGWAVGQYTNLSKLFESILYGNGSQPDAYYEKKLGSTYCAFDSNAAFETPNPAGAASNMYCSRVFDIFGNPLPSYVQNQITPGPLLLPGDHL